MVRTGGTLKPKLINLIGQLDQDKTLANINKDITALERKLRQDGKKIKIDVELFGNVKDIGKNISDLQKKLEASPSFKDIKVGVALEDVNVKDINEQIEKVQKKFNEAKTANKLKLDVEFDFTGSASKIKEEMEGIRQFMARYGEQMKNMDILNLDKDAENAKKNAGGIKTSIQTMGQGIDKVSNDIEADMRKMTNSSGKFGVTFERDVSGAIKGATGTLTSANGTIERFKYNVDDTSKELVHMSTNTKVAGDQQERLEKAIKQTDDAQRKLNQAMKTAPDNMPKELAEVAQGHINSARAMAEHGKVTDQGMQSLAKFDNTLSTLNKTSKSLSIANDFQETQHATREMVNELGRLGQLSETDVKRFKDSISDASNGSTEKLKVLQREVEQTAIEFTQSTSMIEQAMNRLSSSDRSKFTSAINTGDITTVKRYVEELYGAEVASIRLSERKDKLGQSVSRVAVGMKEVDGAVKSYTLDMNKADGSIKEVNASTKTLSDSNKGLEGGFGTIISRMAQYMGVMQVIQKSMQLMKATWREIQEIDKQRIELARVADPSLNLDVVLERSVEMSKELGTSVTSVIESVAEMARTFGDFNEAQLIAITRTATIATNVSGLNMSEATSALVASIQAFNIEAEDSIRIIDALNEVDNNYAINTHQLAEGLQRAGATANTFGVEMEELTGHITAVGAVTQESGQRIGTALRTIYSRITTIDDSRDILENLGIAMYEMGASGPEIRNVSDILGDLSKQWSTLSDEQRQNIGVTIAGRSRLTQFLALMNNYQMAIDATASAYNSQGSAMREQEQYMQSYEYQQEVMKASASELALTIEKELVGDAMYLFMTTLTDLIKLLDKTIEKFGVLPTIIGGATTAFLAFGGERSRKAIDSVTSGIENLVLKMATSQGMIGKFGDSLLGIGGALGGLGSVLAGGAIVGGVMFLTSQIEKLVASMAETRRANEEADRAFQQSMDLYNQNGRNIDGMIDRYEELNKKLIRNKEALEQDELHEYNMLITDLSTIMPSAVSHIDAQGEAHLKSANTLRDNAKALKEMAESHSAYVETLQQDDVTTHFEEMEGVFKRYNDAFAKVGSMDAPLQSFENFSAQMQRLNPTLKQTEEDLRRIYEKSMRFHTDASSLMLSLEYELHGAYQETLLLIGDQTVAYMGSRGELENVSTTAQALIRDYAKINEERIEGIHLIKDEEERLELYNKALQDNRDFGDLVAQAYDKMAEGMNGLDTDRAIQEFDNLINSLPDEALKGSMGEIEGYFDGMSNVVTEIMTNSNADVDSLVKKLVNAGMDIDVATGFIIDLGLEMENQAIRVAVAEESLTEYNDELTHTRDLALETINPLSQLFGLDSDQAKAIDSHVQTLQVLRQQYGKTWHEMDQGKFSVEALAKEFNVSESFIISNIDEIGQAVRAINTATVEWSNESQKYIWKFDENVTKSTKNLVMKLIESGDAYSGFINAYVENNGMVEHSQKELLGFTEEINKRFDEFAKGPKDRNAWNLLMTELKEQLEHLHGSFMVVEDDLGNIKFQMADGSDSEYFDNLNKQLRDSNLEIELARDGTDRLLKLFVEGLDGESLHTLAIINEMAQSGTFAIEGTEEALKALINTATSDKDKEGFVEYLRTQMEFLSGDIVAVKNEAGEMILAFEDPSLSSPWLESLNEIIEELGLKIEVAEDLTGEFHISLQTKEGETIFTQTAGEAQEAIDKVDEADKKITEVTEKEREPISMYLDKEEADEDLDNLNLDLLKLVELDPVIGVSIDREEFDEEVDEALEKAKELEDERVMDFKLNVDEEGINNTVEKMKDIRLELLDIDEELAELERVLRVTNEQMGGLMTNTRNISDARNAIISLKEDVIEAISKMGELYEKFSSGGIDTSGFEGSAQKIREEIDGVETSLRDLQSAVAGLNSTMEALNAVFNIDPGMTMHTSALEATMMELSIVVRNAFISINESLNVGNVVLERSLSRTSDNLGQMVILYRMTKELVIKYIEDMGLAMNNDYIEAVTSILMTTSTFNNSMNSGFSAIAKTVTDNMSNMSDDMVKIFKEATNTIVSTASSLPNRIGGGIISNMSGATNSMGTLAKNMVSRFKAELGIRSPSRVFESLGGDVIDGLVNGLSGSDITNLGQSVFSDFSAGAISTIDQIKGYMEFSPISAGSFGGAFSLTSGFGPRRSPGGIGSTSHKGMDFGAPMGTPIPSQSSGRVVASGWMGGLGNAVIIESAGGVQHVYGHNSANYVSVGQTVGRGQAIGAVGSTGNSTGPHVHYEVRVNGVAVDPRKRLRGFAKGGFVDREELAFVGEEGLEAIIPLMPHRKERGLDLWAKTGEILGMNSSLLEMLIRSQRRSGSFSSSGGFSGLDGEAGGGETATATSGTIAPDYSSIMRSLGTADQPMFSGMASKDKNKEKMEDLYRRDMHAINVGRFSSMLTKANTELTALMKNTLKYRNALEEVNYQERRLRDATQKQLNASIKRQSQIEKELGKLRNTSKHTADQRKKYNELQQEFDKNSESIMSMENEIRKLNISMDQRKVEIYTDYIGQLTEGFNNLTKAIDKTISDLQFSLDYLTLTDENNIGAQLKIQYDMLRESIRLENTLMNSVNKLQAEYSRAVSRYGKDSQQALLAREELYSAESNYQSSVLNRVKLEQSVAKTRKDIANEGIDTLKSYYKQTQTMTERAIELERKALEKHHENKMSMYDKEIAKIESVYDARIAEMDAQEAEDTYNETISDLNTQRTELMQQISRASRDTSLEGRKRLAELQSELGEVNSEIATTQKDRQDRMYREAIERQKQEQIQAIEMQKERAEMEQKIRLESLDQQLADAQNYAERMTNDEAMWERLRSEFIAGDGTGLAGMTNEMTEQMSRFMSGDFRGISMGYGKLSGKDRDLFSEDTLLEISNLMLKSSESMERFVSTANENVQKIGYVAGRNYNSGAITTGRTGDISTQAKASPTTPPAPKPAPKPKADNRHYTVKRGDTLWDLAQKYYGNPYQWTKIAQANANLDPKKLQVGKKLIIPFDTGGYTGNWMDNEGRIALLHKKELVLNENQTRDILDVAKIVDKISGFIPRINASRPNLGSSSITNTGDSYNLETLVLEIPDFKGDEKDARRVFDNMAKSLKKLGK